MSTARARFTFGVNGAVIRISLVSHRTTNGTSPNRSVRASANHFRASSSTVEVDMAATIMAMEDTVAAFTTTVMGMAAVFTVVTLVEVTFGRSEPVTPVI